MVLSLRGHVIIGTSTINMSYCFVDNIDCMTSYKLREWKAAFGVRPIVCCEAWAIIAKRASMKKLSPKHFYWALCFMRTYQVETEVIDLLSASMPKVVSLQSFFFYCCVNSIVSLTILEDKLAKAQFWIIPW